MDVSGTFSQWRKRCLPPPLGVSRFLEKTGNPAASFQQIALELYAYQRHHNPTYARYIEALGLKQHQPSTIAEIPFLPIALYREQLIQTNTWPLEAIFESSTTSNGQPSRHAIDDLQTYERLAIYTFESFYGPLQNMPLLALLPDYLSRPSSSLVAMLHAFMQHSNHPHGGFFLHNHEALANRIHRLASHPGPKQLWGLPQALLDFFSTYTDLPLKGFTILHTGGIKQTSADDSHMLLACLQALRKGLPPDIPLHAEYSMTELFSQAYAPSVSADGVTPSFRFPPWVQPLLRAEDDPLGTPLSKNQQGVLQLLDLSAVHSCAFLATDDLAICHPDNSFKLCGRLKHAPAKGCHHLM